MADVISWVMVIALVAVLAAIAAALWRFFTVRAKGTNVILRHLPAEGLHGWRHGILRYRGEILDYYKLRSLKFGPNLHWERRRVDVVGHRKPDGEERGILFPGAEIVAIAVAEERYELALSPRAAMALSAWVESAPDVRQQRIDYRVLRNRLPSQYGYRPSSSSPKQDR